MLEIPTGKREPPREKTSPVAGSGADTPVSPDLIRVARESCDLTLVVGGGIRDGVTARKAAEAGADWVITGNLSEDFEDVTELQRVLSDFIEEMNSHLN